MYIISHKITISIDTTLSGLHHLSLSEQIHSQTVLYSHHLSAVTFAVFVLYAYRNLWPLMTFTLVPKDRAEGNIMWAKLALAAFAGAVEPLFEPYP